MADLLVYDTEDGQVHVQTWHGFCEPDPDSGSGHYVCDEDFAVQEAVPAEAMTYDMEAGTAHLNATLSCGTADVSWVATRQASSGPGLNPGLSWNGETLEIQTHEGRTGRGANAVASGTICGASLASSDSYASFGSDGRGRRYYTVDPSLD